MNNAKRSSKGVIMQTRRSKASQRAIRVPKRVSKKDHGASRVSAPNKFPSLAERVHAEREQLFKALAIVECCKYASATLYEVIDPEYIVTVFDAVCDLLDKSAGELGRIVDDYRDGGNE